MRSFFTRSGVSTISVSIYPISSPNRLHVSPFISLWECHFGLYLSHLMAFLFRLALLGFSALGRLLSPLKQRFLQTGFIKSSPSQRWYLNQHSSCKWLSSHKNHKYPSARGLGNNFWHGHKSCNHPEYLVTHLLDWFLIITPHNPGFRGQWLGRSWSWPALSIKLYKEFFEIIGPIRQTNSPL